MNGLTPHVPWRTSVRSLLIATTAVALVIGAAAQRPRTHDLPLSPEHVHWGYYDARAASASNRLG